jgi:hypothetical protein
MQCPQFPAPVKYAHKIDLHEIMSYISSRIKSVNFLEIWFHVNIGLWRCQWELIYKYIVGMFYSQYKLNKRVSWLLHVCLSLCQYFRPHITTQKQNGFS